MKASFALTFLAILLASVFAAPTASLQKRTTTLFPNYLIPLKQSTPNTAYPTQYTATILYNGDDSTGNEQRTIVGFDIPGNNEHNCTISFVLPAPVLGGYPHAVNGSGRLEVYGFNGQVINGVTNWNNRPPRYPLTPLWTIVQPTNFGPATVTGSPLPCNHGERMDFEVVATKGAGPTYFDWFELTTPKTGITLDTW
ncbi:ubiquitin 3 binding protein But2 C-terminal domain-domain-containing protein [Tuber borchii]|uniref:Ubiquitin 3 binding protein But2 C-terminal domain-domain-containing protein n=1 Tax=Tuber borchii TaxID=42251 RepID=A0A2T6ZJG3_TUBBO|nr:ubiquitin 3 binding protein But2 C-terminal domain-domain-containing protein [Tuber borchii]